MCEKYISLESLLLMLNLYGNNTVFGLLISLMSINWNDNVSCLGRKKLLAVKEQREFGI